MIVYKIPLVYLPIIAGTLLEKYFESKLFNSGTGTLSLIKAKILKNISIIATE